jgi:hypothetical protein
MKTIPPFLFFCALLVPFTPFVGSLRAADGDEKTTSIAFGKPEAPHTLRVETMTGDVTVTGGDVDKVTVQTSAKATGGSARREDGLRVIAADNSFSLTERDNVVYLSQDYGAFGRHGADFRITVPRDTAVIVKIGAGGDVRLNDLSGDAEVSNLNGSVKLENVSGGVAVDTMNGEVTARYAALAAGKSHSFSSMNGEIRLYVPAAAKATFTLRAQNGTVATDFDEKVFVTRTENRPGEGLQALRELRAGKEFAHEGIAVAREAVEMAREIANEAMKGTYGNQEEVGEPPEPEAAPEAGVAKAPKAPKPPKPPKAPRAPHFPSFPAFGGQVVTGTLNGGGVEIRATTMSGEIQIREAK